MISKRFTTKTDNYGGNMTLTKADLVQQVYKNHEGLNKGPGN